MKVPHAPKEYKNSPYTLRVTPEQWVDICAMYSTAESDAAQTLEELVKAAPWHAWIIEQFMLQYDLVITEPRKVKFFRSDDGRYLEFIAELGVSAIHRSKA